jgi:hypothetical protein
MPQLGRIVQANAFLKDNEIHAFQNRGGATQLTDYTMSSKVLRRTRKKSCGGQKRLHEVDVPIAQSGHHDLVTERGDSVDV